MKYLLCYSLFIILCILWTVNTFPSGSEVNSESSKSSIVSDVKQVLSWTISAAYSAVKFTVESISKYIEDSNKANLRNSRVA
ncbi:hypothetical protein HMI54_000411 [Coelomomyces lativittatus]|nr:hypothetical protein HMI54_000411 [Coelomomyces lativittatus]